MKDLLSKVKFKRLSEDAVSPVIGVILMVAITVILAAVIAVFVFSMADDVQTTKTVGVTAKLQDGNVTITYMGGTDDNDLLYLHGSVDGKSPVYFENSDGSSKPPVGAKLYLEPDATKDTHTVIVVGEFSDGNEQVLLDTIL